MRSYIASAALDVYEAILMGLGSYEVSFASQTLTQLVEEMGRRGLSTEREFA